MSKPMESWGPREVARFWRRIRVDASGCWLWTGGAFRHGYGRLDSVRDGRRVVFRVHRMSYELCVGAIPDGMCVCHSCDVPGCVYPGHLWLGTVADNNADKARKGREARGDRHGSKTKPESVRRGESSYLSKFTENDVKTIRRKREDSGVLIRELAAEYDVSTGAIKDVLLRRNWKHVA